MVTASGSFPVSGARSRGKTRGMGKVEHLEIAAEDVGRAKAFYGDDIHKRDEPTPRATASACGTP